MTYNSCMEEERKAIRTMREFVDWYEKSRDFFDRERYSTINKLQEFYVKFRYICDQEPPEKSLIIEK